MQIDCDIILFDTAESHANLLPLSYTRPVADFRLGITTLREKWESLLGRECRYLPVEYLREKFGCETAGADSLYVAGCVVADERLAEEACSLRPGEAVADEQGEVRLYRGSREGFDRMMDGDRCSIRVKTVEGIRALRYVFDIFLLNAGAIEEDYRRITSGRESALLGEGCLLLGGEGARAKVFVEEGATVAGVTLNVKDGPIYIGRDVQVMEGASLRGPIALCRSAKVKMGARIYGGTTFGPYCKVGGEVDNTVIFGYSNKAHDGYLGNAVIGEWCNIGAGTNASNLKNDYSKIRIWNYASHTFMRTDLQFCGLIMGDHSKAGINCMFNTATVVGVGVNLHGAGFPRVFIPSFSEGSPSAGFSDVVMRKFYDIAERAMARRGHVLEACDRRIFEKVRELASQYK